MQQNTYTIKLTQFEGPFDLLLFFIERDELNIYDIPISKITEDFLAYIREMEALNIDLASEFILVAATLMRIKAKMLIPRKEIDEEGNEIDPRDELVARLIEYKRYKAILEDMRGFEENRSKQFERGNISNEMKKLAERALIDAELESLTLFKLLKAFGGVLERMEDRKQKAVHKVYAYDYTIPNQQVYIFTKIRTGKKTNFKEIFGSCENRMHAIITFLALLELLNMQKLKVTAGGDGLGVNVMVIEQPSHEDDVMTSHDGEEGFEDGDGELGEEINNELATDENENDVATGSEYDTEISQEYVVSEEGLEKVDAIIEDQNLNESIAPLETEITSENAEIDTEISDQDVSDIAEENVEPSESITPVENEVVSTSETIEVVAPGENVIDIEDLEERDSDNSNQDVTDLAIESSTETNDSSIQSDNVIAIDDLEFRDSVVSNQEITKLEIEGKVESIENIIQEDVPSEADNAISVTTENLISPIISTVAAGLSAIPSFENKENEAASLEIEASTEGTIIIESTQDLSSGLEDMINSAIEVVSTDLTVINNPVANVSSEEE